MIANLMNVMIANLMNEIIALHDNKFFIDDLISF